LIEGELVLGQYTPIQEDKLAQPSPTISARNTVGHSASFKSLAQNHHQRNPSNREIIPDRDSFLGVNHLPVPAPTWADDESGVGNHSPKNHQIST
jgi:hypothetical protein